MNVRLFSLLGLLGLMGCSSLSLRGPFQRPLIIGHRGAPGYVPEHTLRSYSLALDFGADFIEPDVVFSKDGILVIRHENEISQTTNVAQVYPDRKATKVVDGQSLTGWFTEDFTLAELKKLRAKERLDFRSHKEDGLYEILTFEEYLQFVRAQEKIRHRAIGIIPEIKHSTYFHRLGFDPEARLVELLQKYQFDDRKQPVIIQSFEVENLKRLRKMTSVELMQLIDEPDVIPPDRIEAAKKDPSVDLAHATSREMMTARGLKEIATYANWVSPEKGSATALIHDAHAVNLKVSCYTFRSEAPFLPKGMKPEEEYAQFFAAGVDGVFSDFSDMAVKARQRFLTP